MGEIMSIGDPRNELIVAIESHPGSGVIEKIIERCEGGLSETILKAAESIEDPDAVTLVLDYILAEGLDVPHDFPTQIHWAIARGHKLSALYLAEIIVDTDREIRFEGMTPKQFAIKKGMQEVADMLA